MTSVGRRHPCQSRCGLTLIEVLAALVILGLLAVAVVPVLRAGAAGQTRLEARIQARAVIDAVLAKPGFQPSPRQDPVADHPDWRLVIEPQPLEPGPGIVQPARTWWRIAIRSGDQPEQILAESVQAWPDRDPDPGPSP